MRTLSVIARPARSAAGFLGPIVGTIQLSNPGTVLLSVLSVLRPLFTQERIFAFLNMKCLAAMEKRVSTL